MARSQRADKRDQEGEPRLAELYPCRPIEPLFATLRCCLALSCHGKRN